MIRHVAGWAVAAALVALSLWAGALSADALGRDLAVTGWSLALACLLLRAPAWSSHDHAGGETAATRLRQRASRPGVA
jgi:hypothetical protein